MNIRNAQLMLGFIASAYGQGLPPANLGPANFSKIQALVHERVDSGVATSIAIAVSQHGRIIWEHAYGFVDREKRISASINTPYYLASVSKTITAMAVMELAQRKQLDLDEPANDYLGSEKLISPRWDTSKATVRRLVNHTAGLATYDYSCYSEEPHCRPSGDDLIHRYGVLVWPPGEKFDYSNAGYGVLGEIISHVSHRSLSDFLRKEIFQPLGMKSCFLDIDSERVARAAIRYNSRPPNAPTPASTSTTPGGSSIYCSVHDVALLGMFHLKDHLSAQKAILSDSSIDAMRRPTGAVDSRAGYGLSWWVQDDLHGFKGVLAQGGTNDATAYLQLIPSDDIAVAMLWNTGTPSGGTIVDETLALLLPRYAEELAKDRAKQAPSSTPRLHDTPEPGFIGQWTGSVQTYHGEVPLSCSIDVAGRMKARVGSEPEVSIESPRFGQEAVSWRMSGTLGLDDPSLSPYSIGFELHARDNLLTGAATAQSEPQARHGARLSFWVELAKQP